MQNVEKKFNQQHTDNHQDISKEGETIIDKKPIASKKRNDDVGEYVDFEEVDD